MEPIGALGLLVIPVPAIVLPTVQVAWLREQVIEPAVAYVKLGVLDVLHANPLGNMKASNTIDVHTIPSDFFESAAALGNRVNDYVQDQLEKNAADFGISEEIRRLGEEMHSAMSVASDLKIALLTTGNEQLHAEPQDISDEMGKALMVVLEELQAKFPQPEEAPGHETRKARVSEALRHAEDAIVKALVGRGMYETTAREHLDNLRPHVEFLVVVSGDLAEQHPVLLEVLLFAGSILLIPESWVLRPLMSLFGFGPYGPIKGTVASWSQRFFFGAAVREGSWFAHLQAAAMRPAAGWWKIIVGGIAASIGLIGTCFGRR
ncbi:predicted protein [Sparassis crispa]|uniref:Uncharacterized protein n=1 Tax=Sparassis crispa TaxID=139825 RepID=A0A401H5A8_9APHY|nr:predicted protein [Sparassis crispa]GBE89581.1 predicted protein [Sparassis crispa]